MLRRRLSYPLFLLGLLMCAVGAALLLMPSHTVEAQCGSQASSCKDCHEVQGAFPVNTDGTGWHESHAFGDFCYICHAGNQQAAEIEAAHTGMVPPLSDTKASCEMCHAADLDERAQVYAVALNVDLGSASSDSDNAPIGEASSDDFWGSEPEEPASTNTTTEAAVPAVVTDTNADVCVTGNQELVVDDASLVNYAERYDEIVLGKRAANWGNLALGGLIGLLVLGGGGFIVFNELRLHTSIEETRKLEGEYPADVVEMLPALSEMKPQNRTVLKRLLSESAKTDKVLGLIDTVITHEEDEENPQ